MDIDTFKLEQLAGFLERGPVLVNVDGRACSGLPAEHRNEPQVCLRVGYMLKPDIDLRIGGFGFEATLLFEGTLYPVQVPWSAVFVVISEAEPRIVTSYPDSAPRVDTPARPRAGLKSVD